MTMSDDTLHSSDVKAAKLRETEDQLRQVIETLIELGIMVHDFQGTVESKEGLIDRVTAMMQQLGDLNVQAYSHDEMFPMDVVE